MFIDATNTVVMEQNAWPGSIGDSCAETSRLYNILNYLELPNSSLDLTQFVTPTGYVRHPTSPWREDDFTADQFLPLLIANKSLKRKSTKATSLAVFVLSEAPILIGPVLWIQAQLFKLPWRWNDSKHWFERMEDSSADYLNWFQLAMLYPPAKAWVPKDILLGKIKCYYAPEPNSQWLLDLYRKAIDKYYIL